MKRELMEVLVCPMCKGKLGLEVTEEQGTEIASGSLSCPACHHVYPISEGIPNLLPQNYVERDGDPARAM